MGRLKLQDYKPDAQEESELIPAPQESELISVLQP